MPAIGFKVIRGLFYAGEKLAPIATGKAAFAMFCRTPSRRRLSDRERQAIERASDLMLEARHHCLTGSAGRFTAYEFRSPEISRAGTALVLHGWGSRTEHMAAIILGLRERGYRVIALDFPGHGRSAGRRLHMGIAVEAAAMAAQWFGDFDLIVGHSFGGAVAVNAAAGSIARYDPLNAGKLVLIAAPDSMPLVFKGFAKRVGLGPRSYSSLAAEVERVAGRPLEEFVCSRLLAAERVPTLVIHAPDDREVPASEAENLAAAGPHIRLEWVHGQGHRRILAAPATVAAMLKFALQRRQPADGQWRTTTRVPTAARW